VLLPALESLWLKPGNKFALLPAHQKTKHMSEEKKGQIKNNDSTIKPEPETLHTTDPQEKMEGPVSSLMQSAKEAFENKETKEEADEKKEKDE
jgi:hypothetical protein